MSQQLPATIKDAPVSAVPQPDGALIQTESARAIAEVQAAMVVARKFPRDMRLVSDRLKNACARPALAAGALYQYARGGTDITGPTIRLAEVLAQSWGNMQFGVRELSQRNGESVVQAFAWDMETNVRSEKAFTVPHVRHTKRGSYNLEDPRDIYEAVANQGARRVRACILAVIPGDVVEEAVSQCEATLRADADTSPEATKIMVEAFAAFGVTKTQIEKRIQRRLDAIQPAQVVMLRKVYASLRDGMSGAAEWFDPEDAPGTDGLAGAEAPGAAPTGDQGQTLPQTPAQDSDPAAADYMDSVYRRAKIEGRDRAAVDLYCESIGGPLTQKGAADFLADWEFFSTGLAAWSKQGAK